MATYKLLQDIEAEDHILGPLTLRQFIFALIAVFCFYICFVALTKHVAFLLVLFLPPGLFCAFFAVPFGRDQPTEVWALAKIRFFIKPRKRIWDQSGVKELVTVTAPKKIEHTFTNGLSQNEVQSRLNALANTIDSRGWAIKNVNVNAYAQPDPLASVSSDRLIDMSAIPQDVPNYDVQAADDILDETSNPIAQQFDQLINQSTQTHRRELIDEMNDVRRGQKAQPAGPPADYWFMNQPAVPSSLPPDQAMFSSAQIVQPADATAASAPVTQAATPDEAALDAQLKARNSAQPTSYAHLRTLQPLSANPPQPANPPASSIPSDNSQPPAGTPPPNPAILSLANNNDLNVATLAREAHKAKQDESSQDEVVISLH
ncbi:MAG: PrgI family protein [Candidatus Saccharimonadales bacterium]